MKREYVQALIIVAIGFAAASCSDNLEPHTFEVDEHEPFEPGDQPETAPSCELDSAAGRYRAELSPCISVDLEFGEVNGSDFVRATGCNRCDGPIFVSAVTGQSGEQVPRFELDSYGRWSLVQKTEVLPLVGSIEGDRVEMIGGSSSHDYRFFSTLVPVHVVREVGPGEGISVTGYHEAGHGSVLADLSRPLLLGIEVTESEPSTMADTFWYLRDFCMNDLVCDVPFIEIWSSDVRMPVDLPIPSRPEIFITE